MAVGVERRAKKAASRSEHALLLDTAMSYSTLSHSTGVGLPVTQHTSLHRADKEPLDFDSANPESHGADPDSQANKKRRSSKSKVPNEIRRSSSTPHMRNLGGSGELSPTADKRRNKLGYHRTSVACGHCRRRKIRCLVANDDPQGRCANCIRLKKECNFYPVEQNPEMPRSQSGPVKDATAGAPASNTSSPRHPSSIAGDKVDEFRPPFAAASAHPPSRYGVPQDAEIAPHQVPSSGGIPVQQPSYAYPPPIETQWPTPGFLPSSSVAEGSPTSSGYWRPSPSTANSAYGSESNVSGAHTPATVSSVSNMSYSSRPESHNWTQSNAAPPTRSMSYGNIEGLPHHYSNHGLGIHQQEYSRRAPSYGYPTTIDTNHSTLHSTSVGSATAAPLSAPILSNQHFNYPPAWNPYGGVQSHGPDVPIQNRTMSAQWYHEPGQLDQVQEEGGPPVTYNHPNMQPYFSGP